MTRKVRSDDDLRWAMNEGVLYEFGEMLACEQDLVRLNALNRPRGHESNLAVEGFLLHARNLIDFLYQPPNPKPDDVLAVDIDPTWADRRPPELPEPLREARGRMNKMLSHLSYARRTLDKRWRTDRIASAIDGLLEKFIEGLPPDARRRAGLAGE